jgi:hypothetical protein
LGVEVIFDVEIFVGVFVVFFCLFVVVFIEAFDVLREWWPAGFGWSDRVEAGPDPAGPVSDQPGPASDLAVGC